MELHPGLASLPGRSARRALVAALAGVLLPLAARAQPPDLEGDFQVRPGTVIRACGGFAFRCEAWSLSGTLSFATDPPRITAADLRVTPLGADTSLPFPAEPDLQLTALEGSPGPGEVLFESAEGGFQTVALRATPFADRAGAPTGWFLEGQYDEGCCDRFVVDLGLVPLLPLVVEGALGFHRGRFIVSADFSDFEGVRAEAVPVALDDQSGFFWFFDADNPELFVKILDACDLFGRYWIFIAGLTNLGVDVMVLDQQNDYGLVYHNEIGGTFETVLDTQGYPCQGILPGGTSAP
ncbi:MAG TPA: hypothetical protein VMV46_21280 [Thermoanaerobaculia bacterium]|nr:hypothetical protein [Thermoanaerobaculia bacterium]